MPEIAKVRHALLRDSASFHTVARPALACCLPRAVVAPCEVASTRVDIGTSLGIAVAPENGEDPGELPRMADYTLYLCKDADEEIFFFGSRNQPEMPRRHARPDANQCTNA